MKKTTNFILLLFWLMVMVDTCQAQDSLYCMPRDQARKVAGYAIDKLKQDTLIADLRFKLLEQELEIQALRQAYRDLRVNRDEADRRHASINESMEKAVRHWQGEAIREKRGRRLERWLIPVAFTLGVVVAK